VKLSILRTTSVGSPPSFSAAPSQLGFGEGGLGWESIGDSLPHLSDVVATASFGNATLDGREPEDFSQLIARADRALYSAKQSGRNRIAIAKELNL
jgi:GGDEF domain-containing protein